jgi:hypothetical protein
VIVKEPRPALKFSDSIGVEQADEPAAAVSVTLLPLQMDAEDGVTVGTVVPGKRETFVVTVAVQVPLDAVREYRPTCAPVIPVKEDTKELDEYPLGPVHAYVGADVAPVRVTLPPKHTGPLFDAEIVKGHGVEIFT